MVCGRLTKTQLECKLEMFQIFCRGVHMIVVRCRVCGVSIRTTETHKVNGYSEEFADSPCAKCIEKPNTTEQKLLKAIFGETSWD